MARKPRNRTRAKPRADKKYFTKTADRAQSLNFKAVPMRGGFRI